MDGWLDGVYQQKIHFVKEINEVHNATLYNQTYTNKRP